MKRLFGHSQPTTTTPNRRQRNPRSAIARLLLWLFLLCGVVVLTLGITTTLVTAQSDGNLKEQEDQFIRDYALPSSPAKPPVYKPRPASPPKQQSPSSPQRQAVPQTQRQASPAPAPQQRQPAPQQRQNVAPRPAVRSAPPPVADEPPRARRREPVQETVEDSPSEDLDTSTAKTLPSGQYVLEFNRSPVVGNRFRLQGIYSEARLGFTRPRGWKMQSAKALIRFQHSPSLLANRSNLTVRVNDRSVGSVPLNRKEAEVGSVTFNIPPGAIQDYNDLSVVVQQNTDPQCSDPSDPTLWTEILPDSKLVFGYQSQAVPLSFSGYPYPFFDELSLEPNRIAYLLPKLGEAWLTAAPRLQAALGRLADFRPIETRLVEDIDQVEANERLVIIGTPEDQPGLEDLDLPYSIADNQILDGNKSPLPDDVGVLMLATAQDGSVPVLVATGNGPVGVAKAAQFLVQPDPSKIGTGQAILVSDLKEVSAPPPRQWPRYLPDKNSFALSDIKTQVNGEPFKDVTVRGSGAPPIEIDFRALPDDRFKRGSSMTLRYSYGPQVNPRTSAVEVLLDDVFIGGARLNSDKGGNRETLKVDLPAELIQSNSKLTVAFRLNPREPAKCGRVTDQQLTGTLHSDSSFNLNRDTFAQLPDLKLLRSGYPFTAPQDLSSTAMVVPSAPSDADLLTLLAASERLGRLSRADSVQLAAYTASTLPPDIRKSHHLVGIGIREKFPFPEVFESGGFRLGSALSRQWSQGSINTWPDSEGMIKQIVSPANRDRVLLALTAQRESGLDQVRQVINKDPWFFQLREDTVLISSNQENPSSYDPDAYKLKFLEDAPSTRRIENATLLGRVSRFLQEHWFLLPIAVVGIALLLYGISQLYLKRITDKRITDKK